MKISHILPLVGLVAIGATHPLAAQSNISFSTLAGAATIVGSADGPVAAARFNSPAGVAVDRNGAVYVADTGNHIIRKISGGVVTTLAGLAGSPGSADGAGSAARFFDPTGVAVDSAFNVYVADSGNHTIRRISPAGVVTTLAGAPGFAGSADGAAAVARFNGPRGVSVDSAFNVYVADTFNHTIRKISNGIVTTLAGLPSAAGSADGVGSAARFSAPRGVTVDGSLNVYVADTANNAIRKITPGGLVTTLVGLAGSFGSADGTGSAARFFTPFAVAVDGAGTVFVADTDNQLIRQVTSSGNVITLGGSPLVAGSTDGLASAARFNAPQGIAVDVLNRLYVGDTANNTIRLGQVAATARLLNISTRALVQTGDNVLIAGFIIGGNSPKRILIRGLGVSTNLPGAMPNPRIELHQGSPTIAENDDWQTASNSADIPADFRPADPRESVIFTTVQPGTYTVVVQPSGSTATGLGLVELYDFDDLTATAQLKNLATRGFVQAGDNVMIGGFITRGGNARTQVVVRAVGPSLQPAGVANALANPTLDLRDGNGVRIRFNDNWRDEQQEALQASGLAPSSELESAIFADLPAGLYTAIVAGSNGTSGVGLVEIYNLQ